MHIILFLLLKFVATELYLDMYTYQGIESSACTRLLTAKGTLGCSSKSSIVSGILYQITNTSDIDAFITSTTGSFWAVVMPASLLSPKTLDRLANRIAGIVLIRDSVKPPSYSLDEKIPNRLYGLYKNQVDAHVWNPNGLNMLSRSLDIPVFELFYSNLSNSAANNLFQAVNRNILNGYNSYPLYAMDFRNLMYAEIDSHRCLTKSTSTGLIDRVMRSCRGKIGMVYILI